MLGDLCHIDGQRLLDCDEDPVQAMQDGVQGLGFGN